MLNTLQWEPLATRRFNNRLTMLYKIIHGLVDVNPGLFITKGDHRTRGSQRLYQERTTHPALTNSFFPRTLRHWNNLPTQATDTPSLELFLSARGRCTGVAACS